MGVKKTFTIILIWLPSIIITMFFIPNAINKILQPNQMNEIVTYSISTLIVGIILLLATALFMYNKTLIIGTTVLAFYMTFTVFIHLYKGKPFEVTILIVMATVFAAYIRKPQQFHQEEKIKLR